MFWKGLGFAGICILFVALRWNNFRAPLIRDEGEYAYAAQLLERGIAPYEQAFIQKPPMVIYSYALAGWLLPHWFWALRLLACGCVALATVLLGFIVRLEFEKSFVLPTIWLATPMVVLPDIEQFTANTEMFMLLPLLATLAIYVHSRHRGHKAWHWLAAGFLGATTLGYKYTAAPVLFVVYAAWSVEVWRQTRSLKFVWRCWLWAVLGGLIAVALELGFFLAHDGGARVWECTVRFNRYYFESSNFAPGTIWLQFKGFWSDWWILFLAAAVAFLKPKPRIWFWAGVFICAVLSTGGSSYGHYYVVVMPFWALLAVAGMHSLAAFIAQRLNLPLKGIVCTATAVVVVVILLPTAPWLMLSPEKFAEKKLGGWSPSLESQLVADRVAQSSSPRDYVFVAGSEPQILCYAKRLSPTRFITVYPLMIPSPLAQGYQAEAIRDLQAHPPSLIVLVQSDTSWLRQKASPREFLVFLNKLLEQDYERAGGYCFDNQKGHWVDRLTDKEADDSSLILFRRKNFMGRSPAAGK